VFEPLGITTREVQARTATKEGMEETLLAERPGRHVRYLGTRSWNDRKQTAYAILRGAITLVF